MKIRYRKHLAQLIVDGYLHRYVTPLWPDDVEQPPRRQSVALVWTIIPVPTSSVALTITGRWCGRG